MKALITGVAGFVGSTLASRLVSGGHTVVGIDVLTDYYDIALKQANLARISPDGFEFVEDDLNEVDLDQLLEGVEYVFHEAGQPGVRKSWGSDFEIYTSQNINATQRLLESARRSTGLKKLVYASSSSVYGDAERYPTTERDRPQPISPYGVTKLAAEHLCTLYGRSFGVPTVSLRYFTVYGPRQRPDMAFTRFIKAAILDEEITIFGTGDQIRDFTFVDDVVEANIMAALSETIKPGSVFNVAGGSSISVNGVLDLLAELSGRTLRITRKDPVPGDVFRTGGSTDLIRDEVGWLSTVSIGEGLKRHLEWGHSVFGQ